MSSTAHPGPVPVPLWTGSDATGDVARGSTAHARYGVTAHITAPDEDGGDHLWLVNVPTGPSSPDQVYNWGTEPTRDRARLVATRSLERAVALLAARERDTRA